MICAADSDACRSNIISGGDVELVVSQWNTADAVTMPTVVESSHFQNTTGSGMAWDLSLDLDAKSNSCSVVPFFNAITLVDGFISAESAEMGRRSGVDGLLVSTSTTCVLVGSVGDASRTHTYLSDSSVVAAKVSAAGLTPEAVSCGTEPHQVEEEVRQTADAWWRSRMQHC